MRAMWVFWEQEEKAGRMKRRWETVFYNIDWRELIMEEAEKLCRQVYANYPSAWGEVNLALNQFLTPVGLLNRRVKEEDDPLQYWYSVRSDHTPAGRPALKLAELAVRLLTSAASEAACERRLGHMKLIVGDRRRRLDKNTLFYLAVLSC